jgi:hypothetical protein
MAKDSGAQAFPLAWPSGMPRTKSRESSRFVDKTVAISLRALKEELERLRAGYVVISTNIPLKANGDPYSDPGRMPDPGCAVYFQMKNRSYCLPCDKWITVEENMYAIAKHIEAMRGMERWGVGSVEQMFAGFKQLAAENEGPSWWGVLQVRACATVDEIETAYRSLAKVSHPDSPTGSHDAMAALNAAREQGLSVAKGSGK